MPDLGLTKIETADGKASEFISQSNRMKSGEICAHPCNILKNPAFC